ncbi:protein cofactor assembly of complex c subunit b ccb3, chloroplastic [Galdieria sulphuraria]|nr:protein cofactor assembly of complex c subunit b ccb3, chloroplastic [Galdieria sulphuraria]
MYKQHFTTFYNRQLLFQLSNRQFLKRTICCPHLTRIQLSLLPNTYVTNWSLENINFQSWLIGKKQVWVGSQVIASITEQPIHKWLWVEYLASFTNLVCSVMVIFMVLRIILSWYPKKYNYRFPWSLICWATEPLLVPVRKVAQPVGGVDISPVIWLFVFSLVRELLVGQQGILVLLQSSPG